jgi:hypothetical protein
MFRPVEQRQKINRRRKELINVSNEIPKGSDPLMPCLNQIKQHQVDLIWGRLRLQGRAAAAIVEQFWHDPVQESFATSRHGKIQAEVVRI